MSIITIAAAFANWNEEIKPCVIEAYSADDETALSESWNDYTDALCKDGELTDLQYHYCPAWDAVDHDDYAHEECAFILAAMGVTLELSRVNDRPDNGGDWHKDSRHFQYWLKRSAQVMTGFYSQGSAHTQDPEADDVVSSLLMDTSDIDDGTTFEEWADNLGYDPDSRTAERTFNACREEAAALAQMFTASELADLREIFADF